MPSLPTLWNYTADENATGTYDVNQSTSAEAWTFGTNDAGFDLTVVTSWAGRAATTATAQTGKISQGDIATLQFLTDESLVSRGPLVFLMVVMMMVGGTVNSVVTVVFMRRFPACALRSYIVTMSSCDLVATLVGIPMYIYKLLHAYSFLNPALCRVMFFVVSLSTNCSGFIIVLLAMDRFRRIQSPSFNELDKIRSYYQVALGVFLAVAVTVPFVPMFGTATRPSFSGVPVRMCWVDDKYKDSVYPQAYKIVLGVTFIINLFFMVKSYATIGSRIHDLTQGVKAELLYILEHPPPPNKYMYIYDETPSPSITKKPSRVRKVTNAQSQAMIQAEVDKNGYGNLGFAAKLHAPRPNMLEANTLNVPDMTNKKTSRMKKISTAIQDFFAGPPEPESKSSSSDSSFVSVRACATIAVSVEFTGKTKSLKSNFNKLSPRSPMPPINLQKIPLKGDFDELSSRSTIPPTNLPEQSEASSTYVHDASLASSSTDDSSDGMSLATSLIPFNILNRNTSATESPGQASNVGEKGSVRCDVGSAQSPTSPCVTTDSMVTKHKTTSDHNEVVKEGNVKRTVQLQTPDQQAEPPQTRLSQQRQPRISAVQGDQMRDEALITLYQMSKMRRSSRNTMILLVFFFILTWLPQLIARALSTHPPFLCDPIQDCWTNVSSYAVVSIFVSSTINAFFYCFGSVHFRKQVTLFFKPCKERICPKKRRKKVRMLRKKLPQAPDQPGAGEPKPNPDTPDNPRAPQDINPCAPPDSPGQAATPEEKPAEKNQN